MSLSTLHLTSWLTNMFLIRQYYDNIQYRYQNDEKFWRQCQYLFFALRYVSIGGVIFVSFFLYFTSCVYVPSAIRPFLLPCWFVYGEKESTTMLSIPLDISVVKERSIDLSHLRNRAWESPPGYSVPLPLMDLNESIFSSRLMAQTWVLEVATTVQSFPSKLATVIILTKDSLEMFLNWLIFVQNTYIGDSILINNLLVVSLDTQASKFLKRYEIGHVQLEPDKIPLLNQSYGYSESPFSHKMQTCKFLIAWLLNYIGYSALLIDLDAIILQDISYIANTYPEYDLVTGRDFLPAKLAETWGYTVSSGFILIKATQPVEMLWRTLHLTNNHAFNQHSNLNYALEQMGVSWHENIKDGDLFGRGITVKEKISVLLLPETIVCRRCDRPGNEVRVFYNSDPVGKEEKVKSMQEYGHWKLRIDWRDCLKNMKVLALSRLLDVLPHLSVDRYQGACTVYE